MDSSIVPAYPKPNSLFGGLFSSFCHRLLRSIAPSARSPEPLSEQRTPPIFQIVTSPNSVYNQDTHELFDAVLNDFCTALRHDEHLRMAYFPMYSGSVNTEPTEKLLKAHLTAFDHFLDFLPVIAVECPPYAHLDLHICTGPPVEMEIPSSVAINVCLPWSLEKAMKDGSPSQVLCLLKVLMMVVIGHELAHFYTVVCHPKREVNNSEKGCALLGPDDDDAGYVFEQRWLGGTLFCIFQVPWLRTTWHSPLFRELYIEDHERRKRIIDMRSLEVFYNKLHRHSPHSAILHTRTPTRTPTRTMHALLLRLGVCKPEKPQPLWCFRPATALLRRHYDPEFVDSSALREWSDEHLSRRCGTCSRIRAERRARDSQLQAHPQPAE